MTHFFFLNYKASSTTLYFCFNNKQKFHKASHPTELLYYAGFLLALEV